MTNSSLARISAIVGLIILVFALSGTALAAPQDITMSPTSLIQVIQPGSTYNGNFLVINQGNSGYTFHVYASPYHVSGEDYTPDFTMLSNAPDVASWFTFSTNNVFIKLGQSIPVRYTIAMPKNTPAGGYYAVAFAETKFPQTGNSITLNERVGEIFYLQAAGPVVQKGTIVTWQSDLFQKPPLTATLRVEDSGGVNFPADITVKVEDVFGNPKYTLQTTKEILPQTIRRITVPWKDTPALGLFKVTGTVSFLNQQHTLPTRWVLVMSQTVRLITLGLIIVIVLFSIVRYIYSRRHQSKYVRR